MATWLALRSGAPEAAADRVLRHARAADRVPVPVEDIVRSLGIKVSYDIGAANLIGAASGTPEGDASIWLNPGFEPEWRRWALAHELGHLLLHKLGQVYLYATTDLEPNDRNDHEAEAFARELLLPRAPFNVYLGAAVTKLPQGEASGALAELFGVPAHAARRRIRDKAENRRGR